MPSTLPSGPDTKDLGFGSKVTQQSRERLLNRDGSFNVTRRGLPFLQSLSVYHSLLSMSWIKFLALLGSGYVIFNLLFALGYLLCGDGGVAGVSGRSTLERFAEMFFFSVETSTTIGYGHVVPASLLANLLVTVEAMAGLLFFAIVTGLVFARFSRPNARILFSDKAIIAPYRGITALEFRIANVRDSQLIEVTAKVLLSRKEQQSTGTVRRFHELSLERDSVTFFPLNWTIVHPIAETSPLFGVSAEEFEKSDPELLVLLTAIDETFAQTVHARSSYKPREILWGAKFADVYQVSEDGSLGIELHRIHDTEPSALPLIAGQYSSSTATT